MKCFKFVTENLFSPGFTGKIDYSNFGKEITTFADTRYKGQCARGIHVIPYLEDNVDLDNVIVSSNIIILDVKPEDIVYQNDTQTGKMRVKAATPLRLANEEEIDHIRKLICTNSYCACYFAWLIDKCPRDDTRKAACKNPVFAFDYAIGIDKCSHEDTRKSVCNDAQFAYYYAIQVDKCANDDTREAACKEPYYAYYYALNVDKCGREDTRKAACKNIIYTYAYAIHVDKCKHPDTWKAVKGTEYELGYKKELGSYE